MISISYNVSSRLKDSLIKADSLRQVILLTPVSPQTEITLRWQTPLAHLTGWASLSNQPITEESINTIVNHVHSDPSSPLAVKVLNYKNALNHIREFWTANPDPVTFTVIKELAGILAVNPGSEKEIQPLLAYLQTGQTHPLIQSATAHLYFYPSRLAYLVSLLFLAKYNYNLRGWLSLEDYWSLNKTAYLDVTQQASHSTHTTLWFEFFCRAVITQMEKVGTFLASYHAPIRHLTHRQKAILALLEQPDASVSNRTVQKAFNISQVTASRNLAALASQGQLLVHGSGRSTYYTRA